MKLSMIVEHVSGFRLPFPGADKLAKLSIERCKGTGHTQYVADDGSERWESVSEETLIQDAKEELADAHAYICALLWRSHNAEWLQVVPLLSMAFQHLENPPASNKDVQ